MQNEINNNNRKQPKELINLKFKQKFHLRSQNPTVVVAKSHPSEAEPTKGIDHFVK
jgi:hypothetical protein